MNNWKMMLYRFMQGRYGNDQFSQFLMIAGLVLLLVSNLLNLGLLHTLAWVVLIYGYFRIMSRNIAKRQRENMKFMEIKSRFTGGGGTRTYGTWRMNRARKQRDYVRNDTYSKYRQEADVENYKYYCCRNCGQIVRVPRGKGTVKIICPKCRNTFTDRT